MDKYDDRNTFLRYNKGLCCYQARTQRDKNRSFVSAHLLPHTEGIIEHERDNYGNTSHSGNEGHML